MVSILVGLAAAAALPLIEQAAGGNLRLVFYLFLSL